MATIYFKSLVHDGDTLYAKAEEVYLRQLNQTLETWANALNTSFSNLQSTVTTFLTGEDDNNNILDRLSELVAAIEANADSIDDIVSGYVKTENVANNLTTTTEGKVLDARQGKALKDAVDAKVATADIVDALTSTNTDKPLSANQGRVLKGEISDLDGRIDDLEDWQDDFGTDTNGDLTFNGKTLNGHTGIAYGTTLATATDYTGTLQIIIEEFDTDPTPASEPDPEDPQQGGE